MKCLLRVAHLKGFARKEGDERTEEWISERKQKVNQLPNEVAFPALFPTKMGLKRRPKAALESNSESDAPSCFIIADSVPFLFFGHRVGQWYY